MKDRLSSTEKVNASMTQNEKYVKTNSDLLQGKKILSFPLGMGNQVYDEAASKYNQFMMFKINTDETGSTLYDDVKTGPVTVAQSASGPVTTTGVGNVWSSSKVNSANGDNIIKFGGDAVDKEKWVIKRGLTSLDRAIILPMPNDYAVQTAVQYSSTSSPDDMAKLGDVYNQLGSGAGTDLIKAGASGLAAGIINKLKSATVGGGDITSRKGIGILARNRMATNPKKEVLFEDFGFRNFTFQFTLAPKNEMESEVIRDILTSFRYYALPEISPGKLFYIFPAEFEISFIMGEKDNPNIPRIATSVLNRVGINYSPAGMSWATLPDGMPVQTTLTLEFTEIELIDRNRIWNKDSAITSGY